MMNVATIFLSGLVLLVCALRHPRGATCPHGWWLAKGVRRSGEYVCRPAPIGDDMRDSRGVLVDHSMQPDGELVGRVYCEPNAIPTIVDTRAVACTHARVYVYSYDSVTR